MKAETIMEKLDQNKFIKGTVRVFDKDKSGSALQLVLQTDEFEKLIIDNTISSEGLFFLVNEEVIIKGNKYVVLHDSLLHIIVDSFEMTETI